MESQLQQLIQSCFFVFLNYWLSSKFQILPNPIEPSKVKKPPTNSNAKIWMPVPVPTVSDQQPSRKTPKKASVKKKIAVKAIERIESVTVFIMF